MIWLFPYHIPYQTETPISSKPLGMILVTRKETYNILYLLKENVGLPGKHFLRKINVKDGSKEFYMMVIIIKPL